MKSVYLTLILLSVPNSCTSKNKDYQKTIIYSHGSLIFEKKFDDSRDRELIKTFRGHVDDLSYENGYLWASTTEPSESFYTKVVIWRAKVTRSRKWFKKEYKIGKWTRYGDFPFDTYDLSAGLVALKDTILLGFLNSIQQCDKTKDSCRAILSTVGYEEIVGFDYSHSDAHLYISLRSNSLLRCSMNATTNENCQTIYATQTTSGKDRRVSPVKAAFGAVWFVLDGNQLWKCCTSKKSKPIFCSLFYVHDSLDAGIGSIVPTKNSLYVDASGIKEILRCKPGKSRLNTCKPVFSHGYYMEKFVFIQKIKSCMF